MIPRRLFLAAAAGAVSATARPAFRAQAGIDVHSLRYAAEMDGEQAADNLNRWGERLAVSGHRPQAWRRLELPLDGGAQANFAHRCRIGFLMTGSKRRRGHAL